MSQQRSILFWKCFQSTVFSSEWRVALARVAVCQEPQVSNQLCSPASGESSEKYGNVSPVEFPINCVLQRVERLIVLDTTLNCPGFQSTVFSSEWRAGAEQAPGPNEGVSNQLCSPASGEIKGLILSFYRGISFQSTVFSSEWRVQRRHQAASPPRVSNQLCSPASGEFTPTCITRASGVKFPINCVLQRVESPGRFVGGCHGLYVSNQLCSPASGEPSPEQEKSQPSRSFQSTVFSSEWRVYPQQIFVCENV